MQSWIKEMWKSRKLWKHRGEKKFPMRRWGKYTYPNPMCSPSGIAPSWNWCMDNNWFFKIYSSTTRMKQRYSDSTSLPLMLRCLILLSVLKAGSMHNCAHHKKSINCFSDLYPPSWLSHSNLPNSQGVNIIFVNVRNLKSKFRKTPQK